MTGHGARWVVAVLALATLLPSPAGAAEPRDFSASPELAATSIGWRSQLRGRIGVVIPIAGGAREAGFGLRLPAFIELHNVREDAIPYQLWRGRLVLDATWTWLGGGGDEGDETVGENEDATVYRVGVAVEHESDHSSVFVYPGFLNLNSTSVHGDIVTSLARDVTLFVSAQARLHFLTCTVDPIVCGNGEGGIGDRTFEAAGEASITDSFAKSDDGAVPMLFASTFASVLLPHALARSEKRITFELGGALATARRGTFALLATSLLGDDVGYFRATRSVFQLGGGFRWTP